MVRWHSKARVATRNTNLKPNTKLTATWMTREEWSGTSTSAGREADVYAMRQAPDEMLACATGIGHCNHRARLYKEVAHVQVHLHMSSMTPETMCGLRCMKTCTNARKNNRFGNGRVRVYHLDHCANLHERRNATATQSK